MPVGETMTKDGAARDLERFGAVNAEPETFKPQAEFRVRRRANSQADSSQWQPLAVKLYSTRRLSQFK